MLLMKNVRIKKLPRLRPFALAILMLLISVSSRTVAAQQAAWMNKNIEQWTTDDIYTILNSSPWVIRKTVRLAVKSDKTNETGGLAQTVNNSIANSTPAVDFIYTLRLRSALPIRLALMRQLQIDSDYDHLTKEQRSALNVKLMGIYNCPACAENYVVTLSSKPKELVNADAVFDSLSNAKLEDLTPLVYLMNERGEKRNLVHFTPPLAPGGEATFFFRRLDDQGRPLITPASKEIIFRLADKASGTSTNFIIDVSKLIVVGKVIF